MNRRRDAERVWKTIAASAGAAGLLLASSCNLADLQAVAVGVDAATQYLEDEDDMTFGEWLMSELDD